MQRMVLGMPELKDCDDGGYIHCKCVCKRPHICGLTCFNKLEVAEIAFVFGAFFATMLWLGLLYVLK